MGSEVYSWRLSSELKSELERAARIRKVPVASILDTAVRCWLSDSGTRNEDEEEQRRAHASVASCLGVLAGGNPRRAETARGAVRKRLGRRHAR